MGQIREEANKMNVSAPVLRAMVPPGDKETMILL